MYSSILNIFYSDFGTHQYLSGESSLLTSQDDMKTNKFHYYTSSKSGENITATFSTF